MKVVQNVSTIERRFSSWIGGSILASLVRGREGREGGRKEGREGGREEGRKGGREEERKEGREGRRGERKEGRKAYFLLLYFLGNISADVDIQAGV